jgi:hypothetical protein
MFLQHQYSKRKLNCPKYGEMLLCVTDHQATDFELGYSDADDAPTTRVCSGICGGLHDADCSAAIGRGTCAVIPTGILEGPIVLC